MSLENGILRKPEQRSTTERKQVIENYLYNQESFILYDEMISPIADGIFISVVVPAFNEEDSLPKLLESLNQQTSTDIFEAVVVDNNCTDYTRSVVVGMSKQVDFPLYVLKELEPGAGAARKRAMDEVIRRVKDNNPYFSRRHFIAMTDADAMPPSDWIFSIALAVSKLPTSGAISGNHSANPKLDNVISRQMGIDNYFKTMSSFSDCLDQLFGQVRMRGLNSVMEIEAYAAAGGFTQPKTEDGRILPRECYLLGARIVQAGYPIHHFSSTVFASQRRHLTELIENQDSYFVENPNDQRFLVIRESEDRLLDYAITHIAKDRWIEYQRAVLKTNLKNSLIDAISRNEVYPDGLYYLLEARQANHLQKIIQENIIEGNTIDELLDTILRKIK